MFHPTHVLPPPLTPTPPPPPPPSFFEGKRELKAAEVICPPALRPATIILVAMLGAKGRSTLRNVYSINRGYENIVRRLQELGASIEAT